MSNVQSKPRRTKGEGSIFKNSKGKWIARYSSKGYPTKEFSGNTKTEVKVKLEKWKFLVQSGEAITGSLKIRDFAEKFLFYKQQQVKRGKLKSSTYDRLELAYKLHIQNTYVADVLLCNLKSCDIQFLIDAMQLDYSLSSINKVYLFMHSMIKYGIENKDLPSSYDPFTTVELPKESMVGVKTKEIEIIPNEYLEEFKRVALTKYSNGSYLYRYGLALVFALNTGLREGELLALSKDNIITDENGRKLIDIKESISQIKNRDEKDPRKYKQIITSPKYERSKRRIPLNGEAICCLDKMMEVYGTNVIRNDFIISTKNGRFPTNRNIQNTLDLILKKCGFPHYGTHALRHTFATRLLSKTKSHQEIKAVAELLGDDYKVVLKTYLHTETEGKHNLVDLLMD